MPNGHYSGRTAPLNSNRCILNIYSTNISLIILNMLHNLRLSLFKMHLFHNATLFGCCIIHILSTGCNKIEKEILAPKG
jgi:phosphoglycerol transferase MdoB-like AlkP superfamily enzyme